MHLLVKRASLLTFSVFTLALLPLTQSAAAPKAAEVSQKAEVRTLHFDKSLAIGAIFATTNLGVPNCWAEVRARRIGDARGDMQVTLKADESILLDLGRGAFDHPSLMEKAKLDNIEALKLAYLSFDTSDGKVFDNLAKYLPRFKFLRALNLERSDCSDATLAYLKDATGLVQCNFFSSHIEGAGFKYLTSLDKLEVLNVESCALKDEYLPYLTKLKNLQFLLIGGAGLTDKSMKIIGNCAGLRSLKMPKNQKVTDVGLAHLKNCKVLEALDLREVHITVNGLRQLRHLKIKGLILDENFFTPKEQREVQAIWPKAGIRWFKPFVDKDHETILAPLH